MTRASQLGDILHIRVSSDVHDAIKECARTEQRTVADMARVLLAFALSEMPRQHVPKIRNASRAG